MGDYVSYKEPVTAKGLPGSIQYNDGGGDLAACDSATIVCNPDGTSVLSATLFVGDGGLLSNVIAGGGSVGNLQQVTTNGPDTNKTVLFTNPTTAFTTAVGSNVGISNTTPLNTLHVGGSLRIEDVLSLNGSVGVSGQVLTSAGAGTVPTWTSVSGVSSNLQQVTDTGNVTSNTVQFTNPTTAFTTDLTSNVLVKLDQLSNVNIDGVVEDQILSYDGTNWVNDYNQHAYIHVRNETGSDMYKGNTVYIVNSVNNNIANVALAQANSPSTMPCVGLLLNDLDNDETGYAVAYGKASGVNTFGFSEGETVYVSSSDAGVLTNIKPSGVVNPDLIQNVGIVVKSDASNGIIFVTGVGRTNDIPNANILTDDSTVQYVYVNTNGNDLKKIEPSRLNTGPLSLSISGSSMFGVNTVDRTSIGGFPSNFCQYQGGALAPNGKIYLLPRYASPAFESNIGVIDTQTDTFSNTLVTYQTPIINNGYFGMVSDGKGKIYCMPRQDSNVGVIDTVTNTFSNTYLSGDANHGTTLGYAGGVLAPDGKIYCIPSNASNVLVIDPDTRTVSNTVIIQDTSDRVNKFRGGILAPNGKIYCVPLRESNIGVIDPVARTYSNTVVTNLSSPVGNARYGGGALGGNGKIYMTPFSSEFSIGYIDTNLNTYSNSAVTGPGIVREGAVSANQYTGATLAPSGKIYIPPNRNSNVIVVDTFTNTYSNTVVKSSLDSGDSSHYFGSMLGPNGKIYCIPYEASNVAIIKTGIPNEGSWVLQPEFNKIL